MNWKKLIKLQSFKSLKFLKNGSKFHFFFWYQKISKLSCFFCEILWFDCWLGTERGGSRFHGTDLFRSDFFYWGFYSINIHLESPWNFQWFQRKAPQKSLIKFYCNLSDNFHNFSIQKFGYCKNYFQTLHEENFIHFPVYVCNWQCFLIYKKMNAIFIFIFEYFLVLFLFLSWLWLLVIGLTIKKKSKIFYRLFYAFISWLIRRSKQMTHSCFNFHRNCKECYAKMW